MIVVPLKSRRIVGPISLVLMLGLAAAGAAAPQGPPVRIGGTLALTGPLAPTALLHKIAGEKDRKWVVVWPREFAAPGARLLPP